MTLFPLINQEANRQYLYNIFKSGRVANAYLFYGEEGSGTEGFALEFAALLNCQAVSDQLCGSCPSCKTMLNLENPNLTLVYPIPARSEEANEDPFKRLKDDEIAEIQAAIRAKAKNPYHKIAIKKGLHIPINFIREISRTIYLASSQKGYKVVIIFDAHLLTEQAANAFLKILEEPPANSCFILTTSNPDELLPTIKSRCQSLFFPPIPPAELETYFANKGYSTNDVRLAVHLAAGNVLNASQLLESDLDTVKKTTLRIITALTAGDIAGVYNLTNSLGQIAREEPELFKQIMRALLFWIRDIQVMLSGQESTALIFQEYSSQIREFCQKYPVIDCHSMKTAVENCVDFLNHNVYINLALLEMFFNLRNSIKTGIVYV